MLLLVLENADVLPSDGLNKIIMGNRIAFWPEEPMA